MTDKQIFQKAKSDFVQALASTSKKDIEEARAGFAISAMRFTRRYIEPTQNQALYNNIYNLFYNYFDNLKT